MTVAKANFKFRVKTELVESLSIYIPRNLRVIVRDYDSIITYQQSCDSDNGARLFVRASAAI